MAVIGFVLVVLSSAALWFCSPGKSSTLRPFLRGGVDTLAAIAITAGFGVGTLFLVVGIANL